LEGKGTHCQFMNEKREGGGRKGVSFCEEGGEKKKMTKGSFKSSPLPGKKPGYASMKNKKRKGSPPSIAVRKDKKRGKGISHNHVLLGGDN